MAFRWATLAPHEEEPVRKLIELMREQRQNDNTRILAIAIKNNSVEFSVAAPRGRVIIENKELDITIDSR